MKTWTVALITALVLMQNTAFAQNGDAAPQPMDEETRLIMRQLYESIATLLPLTTNPQAFRAPENRAKIQAALNSFAANGEVLAEHVAGWEDTYVGRRSLFAERRPARLDLDTDAPFPMAKTACTTFRRRHRLAESGFDDADRDNSQPCVGSKYRSARPGLPHAE